MKAGDLITLNGKKFIFVSNQTFLCDGELVQLSVADLVKARLTGINVDDLMHEGSNIPQIQEALNNWDDLPQE